MQERKSRKKALNKLVFVGVRFAASRVELLCGGHVAVFRACMCVCVYLLDAAEGARACRESFVGCETRSQKCCLTILLAIVFRQKEMGKNKRGHLG